MYRLWNSEKQTYNKYFNDDYHSMYHMLCSSALEVFQYYYVAMYKRNCLGYEIDMAYKTYLNKYRLSCKHKIVELLSGMSYKEYCLRSMMRVKKIKTTTYPQSGQVTFEFFKHVFQNPEDYEIVNWDITVSKNRKTGEMDVMHYNIEYNLYRDPAYKLPEIIRDRYKQFKPSKVN